MTTTRTLRISCLQAEGIPGDIAHNLAVVDRAAAQAKADGVELLITPEMFVTGYDCGPLEPILGQGFDLRRCTAEIAARHRIALVVGLPVDLPDGSVGNGAIFVDDTGTTLGERAKTHLSMAIDKERFGYGQQPVTIVEYRGVRIAILICMELEFPELARLAALAGAELLAVPTSNMEPYGGINEHLVWTRAWENQIYVAYANRCGHERVLRYPGLSSIYGPSGDLLARGDDRPALLIADVDADAIPAARFDFDYLAERRPDLYRGLIPQNDTEPTSEAVG